MEDKNDMTVDEVKQEHSFTAYNESLTINHGGDKTRITGDFKHSIFEDKEYVEIDGKTVPFHRSNFPFDLHDIRFTKNIENERLLINGKEQNPRFVYHIQIGETEYVLLDGEYLEYNSVKTGSPGKTAESYPDEKKSEAIWKNKKIISALAGVVLVISVAVIFSAIAVAPEPEEQNPAGGTGPYTVASTPETTPEPVIPGYFEKSYSWEYNDRADRILWSNTPSVRRWSMTVSISKNSYYRSMDADHSSRSFSTYVNDTLNREETKQIADKILEMGKKYGYGDFENAMNAASFVQTGLPYTEDKATKGFDDYWRYPVETLVDGGGDCEDSAILLASILQNMGYDVIVIGLPSHAAVAIKDVVNPICGNCAQIWYNNETYMYLESTNTSEIGYIPYEYYGEDASVNYY